MSSIEQAQLDKISADVTKIAEEVNKIFGYLDTDAMIKSIDDYTSFSNKVSVINNQIVEISNKISELEELSNKVTNLEAYKARVEVLEEINTDERLNSLETLPATIETIQNTDQDLDSRLSTVEIAIQDLPDINERNNQIIATIEAGLPPRMTTVEDKVHDIEEAIDNLHETDTNIFTKLDTCDNALSTITDKLDSTNTLLNTTKDTVDGLIAENLTSRVTSLEELPSQVQVLNERHAQVMGLIEAGIPVRVTDLEAKIPVFEQTLQTYVDDTNRQEININNLTDRVTANEEAIANNKAVVDVFNSQNLDSRVTTLEELPARISVLETANLVGRVAALEQLPLRVTNLESWKNTTDSYNLNTRVSTLETLPDDVETLKSELIAAKERISELEEQINTELADYVSKKSSLDAIIGAGLPVRETANEMKIAELEARISALE